MDGLGKIKRLLETHRFNFCLPSNDECVALDLAKAVVPVEERHVRVSAVRSRDAQLPAFRQLERDAECRI